MGFSKKPQVNSDGKKWFIAGISIRASLKPVKTKLRKPKRELEYEEERDQYYNGSEGECVTPKAKEANTSPKCPAAPRKRRPALKCRSNVGVEYFVPPLDLETVFAQRILEDYTT